MGNSNKIAGYYRLSVEDNYKREESNSITNQRLLIKKYILKDAELSQYEYCEFYDDGYSGTTMNRPGMKKLLEEMKHNQIQVVMVKDISRFSRDYIELGTYMEQIFPFMGIRFIAIGDGYDSKDYVNYTSDMDIGFKSLLADFYCKEVSLKVKCALEAKRKQGKYATGLTPFGYEKDNDNRYKLVVVSKEAEVIQYIFHLFASGNNLSSICKILNEEGVKTPLQFKNTRKKKGELKTLKKCWQAGMVKNILINETYIGNMVYNKTVQTVEDSGKRRKRAKEAWQIFENHHEPIIEKELFEKVQLGLLKQCCNTRGNCKGK